MKRSILHIGGHADGESRDIELVEMADGGWQLAPGYTLREHKGIDHEPLTVSELDSVAPDSYELVESYYVRDRISSGEIVFDFYIHYKLRVENESALIEALIRGYRRPKKIIGW